MDAEQKNNWLAALTAQWRTVRRARMPSVELQLWARQTLLAISAPELDLVSVYAIANEFVESVRMAASVRAATANPPRHATARAAFALADTAPSPLAALPQRKPVTRDYFGGRRLPGSADEPAPPSSGDPYASPANYLRHPTIDVLAQETIARISSRDTGA